MADLSTLGEGSAGVWTRQQALSHLSPRQIRTLLADGTWQVALPGVYADGGYVLAPEQRAFAAVLATGGADQPVPFGAPRPDGTWRLRLRAVAAGRTAARVWGFPLIDDDDPATGACETVIDDVAVWYHARQRDATGRQLRRYQVALGDCDIVRLPSGLYLMSPLRTLVDCARLLSFEAIVCALDDALHRRVVDAAGLQVAVASRSGEPGVTTVARGVAAADGRAESPSETLARLLLQPVLPGLRPQVKLFDEAMRLVARFDLGDEELKLAVETDGKRGHAGDVMVAKDRRRDRRTAPYGWCTERLTWFELRRQQAQVLRRVMEEAERLGRLPGSRAA